MKVQVVILCGGEGTRVQHITGDTPKCIYPINGRPFMLYQLEHLKKYSDKIDSYIISCSDKYEKVYKALLNFNSNIYWNIENKPFGTLVGLTSAADFIHTDWVVVLNGDTFCPVDLDKLLENPKAAITVLCHGNENSGVWLIKAGLLRYMWHMLEQNIDLWNETIVREVALAPLELRLFKARYSINYVQGPSFIDMGTPTGIEQAEKELCP